MVVLALWGASKTYGGQVPVHALRDVTLRIEQGDYVAIEGPSGSGKSTLLNVLALLDKPTEGEYLIEGEPTTGLSDGARARRRSSTFAFIFQAFHLLDGRRVLDNVALGTLYRDLPQVRRDELAIEALGFVGLEDKAAQRAAKLSGGERQRVAIARAIASGAPVVVADEPTGNLDSASGALVMDTLECLNREGATVIVVTHDPAVAKRASRRLHVLDGKVTEAPGTPLDAKPVLRRREGRDSKVFPSDGLRDVWRGLWARPSRTLALVAAVTLGVALALTTMGLSETARAQVSAIFDAHRNQWVSMSTSSGDSTTAAGEQATSTTSLERLKNMAGVEAVAVVVTHDRVTVDTGLTVASDGGRQVEVFGIVGGELPDKLTTVNTGGAPFTGLQYDEVVVGSSLAGDLQLGPLLASPVIMVQGQPKRVVGILVDAGLQVGMLGGIIVGNDLAEELAPARYATALLKVQPGAAPQVAELGPLAWVPAGGGISVDAPPDPKSMREQIESNVTVMLLTLTGVTLLAAMLSLTNAMTTAVFQRTGEFGLRRAIGARRVHITGLVLTESLVVGTLGGVLGAYLSVIAVLVVTIMQKWQPVFDPVTIPLGILGGTLVGLLGGLVATQRAARIQPADALRA